MINDEDYIFQKVMYMVLCDILPHVLEDQWKHNCAAVLNPPLNPNKAEYIYTSSQMCLPLCHDEKEYQIRCIQKIVHLLMHNWFLSYLYAMYHEYSITNVP